MDINPEPEDNSDLGSNIDDSTPIDNGIDDVKSDSSIEYSGDFENLNSMTQKLASTIDEVKLKKLNEEILKTISTGKVNSSFTFDNMSTMGGNKRNEFDYFTTVLGSLYKTANSSEKSNIKKALFLAYPVYNITTTESGSGEMRLSTFAKSVAANAKITYDFNVHSKTLDASYYGEILADSIYDAVNLALETYDPERGGKFGSLVLTKSAGLTMDALGSKLHRTTFSGGVGGRTTSYDEPLGSSEEERDETKMDRITGKEGEVSDKEKANVKEFARAIQSFVRTKLSNPKLKNYLEYFNLFSQGHTSAEIADIMGITPGNARIIKKRMEDFITEFVKAGYLQQYIFNKTGIRVKMNEFFLSTQDSKEEKKNVEPVEIFNITGTNPETGEPVGEWTEIIHKKDSNEPTYFDNYGSLISWSNKDDEDINPEGNIENTNDEETNLTESLKKIIQKVISK